MPERRRPGLWKTLVAAAQTAIDSVADGVDALADRAEALADGLRSLGHGGRAPTPPVDPRFAGMDPALAAYVAARDPVWFSMDMQGGQVLAEGSIPSALGDEETALFAPSVVSVSNPPLAPSLPAPRDRAVRRDQPSAAELPGGRPVHPPRVGFRPGRKVSDHATPSDRSEPRPDALPSFRRAAAEAEAGRVGGMTGAPRDDSTPAQPAAAPPAPRPGAAAAFPSSSPGSARTKADAETTPASAERASAPPVAADAAIRPETPSSEAASSVRIAAVETVTETSRTRSDAPAPAPWPSFESPRASSPSFPERSVTSAPGRTEHAEPNRDDRRWAPISTPRTSQPRRQSSRSAAPAPWPELPPPQWTAPVASGGGLLAWSSPSASDVLVDEQRST
jgi:hypothetical protein